MHSVPLSTQRTCDAWHLYGAMWQYVRAMPEESWRQPLLLVSANAPEVGS